jgi:hypothetical protein
LQSKGCIQSFQPLIFFIDQMIVHFALSFSYYLLVVIAFVGDMMKLRASAKPVFVGLIALAVSGCGGSSNSSVDSSTGDLEKPKVVLPPDNQNLEKPKVVLPPNDKKSEEPIKHSLKLKLLDDPRLVKDEQGVPLATLFIHDNNGSEVEKVVKVSQTGTGTCQHSCRV